MAVTTDCLQISIDGEIICVEKKGHALNQRLEGHKTCDMVLTWHIKPYWTADKYLCLSDFTISQTRGAACNLRMPSSTALEPH